MFLDILITPHPDREGDALRQAVSEWVQTAAREHAGYYGTPAGHTVVSGGATAGFRPLPGGGRWLTCNGNYVAVAVEAEGIRLTVAARRHGIPAGFRNLLRLVWPGEAVTDLGPGHVGRSLPSRYSPVGQVTVLAYASTEPDWAPWATRDDVAGPEAPPESSSPAPRGIRTPSPWGVYLRRGRKC